MKEQSLEFIVGYTFDDLQRRAYKLMIEQPYLEELELAINIPKLWFGVKNPTWRETSVQATEAEYVIAHSCEVLEEVFPKWKVSATTEVNHQYQQFKFKFEKKIVRQQLTIKDIEEILGYPIEIVAEKKK